jgi:hypothetical protein
VYNRSKGKKEKRKTRVELLSTIFVNINYRLGASVSPLSLKRKTVLLITDFWILEWISGNIGKFGGNPQSITIAGGKCRFPYCFFLFTDEEHLGILPKSHYGIGSSHYSL